MAKNVGNLEVADEQHYSEVVEVLSKMFHLMMEKDAIYAIVDSYAGNMSNSVDAIVSVLNDGNVLLSPAAPSIEETDKIPIKSENSLLVNDISSISDEQHTFAELSEEQCGIKVTSHSNIVPQVLQSVSCPIETESTKSFATMSRATGAIPKQPAAATKVQSKPVHSDQMQRIIDYHQKGYKVLVIMRGPPGCGKSYLAREIVGNTIGHEEIMYKTHICSTDDFFSLSGRYIYNRDQLSVAHEWNQNRVRSIVLLGMSPVVIDNTNIEFWETVPYVQAGMAEGYYIEVAEPQTHWARNAYQLTKRNSHNVPYMKIKKMLDNFQRNVSGVLLIKILGFTYPANKVPPVLRKIPQLRPKNKATEKTNEHVSSTTTKQNKFNQQPSTSSVYNNETQPKPPHVEKPLNQAKIMEDWEDFDNSRKSQTTLTLYDPKPQGNKIKQEQLLSSANEDWTKITDLMPPWYSTPPATLVRKIDKDKAETNSRGTCVEYGDADFNNVKTNYRVLTGTPRDINFYYMPQETKIPDSIMLDKSTTTNEHLITEAYKCKNVEKHFRAFRKMFKNIAAADLRDIFDKCNSDVNWAVEIVLDGVASNQFETAEEISSSDNDELENVLCECTAAYDIIPQASTHPETDPKPAEDLVQQVQKRKIKKVIYKPDLSDSAIELKKQFEQNMVISDNHYSQHCLKIKKLRHGDSENAENARGYIPDTPEGNASLINDSFISTSKYIASAARESRDTKSTSESSEGGSETSECPEETITVNIGTEFIKQLDTLFGREGTAYPSDILPLVSIPMSLVTTINALWIESLTHQLDMQANYSQIMLKHDEELARALANKDVELLQEDREAEVPDFKQIMDMDLALSLHQKDVANWKNNQPNDWAAKMTRAKLHNLFPDVPLEILSELLAAHDNNFQETVEGLLVSTGQASVLDTENGISKFVMTREIARQVSFLEDERNRVLAESKAWLLKLESEDASLEIVEGYRKWSEDLKVKRDLCVEHANTFLQRGVREMAQRCSETAQFYSTQFDMAKNFSVTAYIRINGKRVIGKNTIDLHYLHVKAALHALDIFIDESIHLLRSDSQSRGSGDDNFLYVITGRGLHSDGGAKIKPAAKKRLKQRGFKVKDKNPGLIFFEYSKSSKMLHELDVK